MSKKNVIIILTVFLLLLGVAVFAQKAQIADRLNFTLGTPRNIQFGGFGLQFVLPVIAENPTSGVLTVNSIELSVYAGSNYVGRASMLEKTTISSLTQTELPIQVTIGYLDLLTAAKPVINNAQTTKSISITLDGFVYSSGLKIPLNKVVTFTLPF